MQISRYIIGFMFLDNSSSLVLLAILKRQNCKSSSHVHIWLKLHRNKFQQCQWPTEPEAKRWECLPRLLNEKVARAASKNTGKGNGKTWSIAIDVQEQTNIQPARELHSEISC